MSLDATDHTPSTPPRGAPRSPRRGRSRADAILDALIDWGDVARQVRSGSAEVEMLILALRAPHKELRAAAAQAGRGNPEVMAAAASSYHSLVRLHAASRSASRVGPSAPEFAPPVAESDDLANMSLQADVSQVHSALHDVNAVVGRFDGPSWHGEERYPAGAGLETAPIADVARFITCIARADRFVDGLLDSYVASGVLARLIDRLATWYQANTTP